jgi:hypothetical protein
LALNLILNQSDLLLNRQASGCDSLINDFCYANADFYTIPEA